MEWLKFWILLLWELDIYRMGQATPWYDWSEWWTYKGISGPSYWGQVNSEWSLCTKGKHQSPINIDPKNLLFDPKLKPIKLDDTRVRAEMVNTGHDITVNLNQSHGGVNISSGPLSYIYKVEQMKLHFGKHDSSGSEHIIANRSFPAELQIFAYNTDLYKNYSHALTRAQGIAAISLFMEVGDKPSKELEVLSKDFINVRYKDWQVNISGFSISRLLPATKGYITYEGSMTYPGCHETVTWIIINKPIYIHKHHMGQLRKIHRCLDNSAEQGPMAGNRRPVHPLYHRAVRTNINFPKRTPFCNMEKIKSYKVNSVFQRR